MIGESGQDWFFPDKTFLFFYLRHLSIWSRKSQYPKSHLLSWKGALGSKHLLYLTANGCWLQQPGRQKLRDQRETRNPKPSRPKRKILRLRNRRRQRPRRKQQSQRQRPPTPKQKICSSTSSKSELATWESQPLKKHKYICMAQCWNHTFGKIAFLVPILNSSLDV